MSAYPAPTPRRRGRAARLLPLVALLSACMTATPSQPLGAPGARAAGGYAERQIEANRFRVTFVGNTMTSRETVETYLLYRAAELTQQQGFDWFVTADRETNRHTNTYVEPGFGGDGGWGGLLGPRRGLSGRGL